MLDVLHSVATKASWLFNATWCIYNECVGHVMVATEGDPVDPTIVRGKAELTHLGTDELSKGYPHFEH